MPTSETLLVGVACVYLAFGLIAVQRGRIQASDILLWPLLLQKSAQSTPTTAVLTAGAQRLAVFARSWPRTFAGHDDLVRSLHAFEERFARLTRELQAHNCAKENRDEALTRLCTLQQEWSATLSNVSRALDELENCIVLARYEPEWANEKCAELLAQITASIDTGMLNVTGTSMGT